MRLNYNEIRNYLFSVSDDISNDAIKAPKLLHLLWSVYDVNFRKNFPLDNNDNKECFLHWALVNIKKTEVYYRNEIVESLLSYNHTIDESVFINNITPIQNLIWRQRPDLINLFPDISGEDNIPFWKWWVNHGYKEYCFDSPFGTFDRKLSDVDVIKFFDSISVYENLNQQHLRSLYTSLHSNYFTTDENLTPLMVILLKVRKDLNTVFGNQYSLNKKKYFQWWNEHAVSCYSTKHTDKIAEDYRIESDTSLKIDKNIAIIGHATGVLGLGEDARLISKSLETIGVLNDLYSSNSRAGFSKDEGGYNVKQLDNYEDGYFANIFPLPANDIIDILIRFGLSPFFGAKYNICIVQWELEYFPKEYEVIKYLMDRVCSISSFSAKSIENTIKEYVSVIPLPFVTDVKFDIENKLDSPCTFYFAFDGNSFISRKNPLAVITAFQQAFKKEENVALVMKVMNSSPSDLWNECLRKIYLDNRIQLIDESLSKQEYIDLLNSVDCVVSLHRSEGFGRIIAESMLLEKPVIVSNYSGSTDYTYANNSFLVNGDIVPLFDGDYHLYQDNFWFEPRIKEASDSLYFVYQNPKKAKEIAKKGRETILDNYNFEKCGHKIKNIIEEIVIDYSGLFDAKYYAENYGIAYNAIEHYVENGKILLGYNPSDEFNTAFYKNEYQDVGKSGMNPLFHYILHGKEEGRKVSFWDKLSESKPEPEPDEELVTSYRPELDTSHVVETKGGMIFISHDATKTGAPLVALDLCKQYEKSGNDFVIMLMSGGELQEEFEKLAPVINLNLSLFNRDISIPSEIVTIFGDLADKGYNRCIANSVLSGFLHDFLSANCIDTTYLVHEMPELIEDYNFTDGAINIANSKSNVVFSTHLAADLFCEKYASKLLNYKVYPQGVSQNMICNDKLEARKEVLKTIGCENPNSKIVLAAGYAHYRKGTDFFIEVAKKCCVDRDDIEFIWLGDKDAEYARWENEVYPTLACREHLHFIDFVSDPSNFFGASDVFLLTSREDPLPGVGLIALQNNVPLIMFKDAGGIEGFITNDNGKLVDKYNTDQMANEVKNIAENGMDVVSNTEINTSEEYFTKVLSTFDNKSITKVSVVVPNYNYEKYLPERLNTIINQTHQVDEIVFLDDCSTDHSINVAQDILEKSGIDYRIISNDENLGIYRQWLKGFELAKNDLVWLAEADDFAEENFLETLIFMFDSNEKLGLAYSQSKIVDQNSDIVTDNVRFHTDIIHEDKWKVSYFNDGVKEIEQSLIYRNSIPNVSSCLINRKYLKGIESDLLKYKYCGDWFLYAFLLNRSNVGFCHRSLNNFRKHTNNVTTTNTYKSYYVDEVLRVKEYMYSICNVSLSMHYKMNAIFETDFINSNPERDSIKINVEQKISKLKDTLSKTLTIVTFNKEFGGSEVMWYDLANSFDNEKIKLSVLCPNDLLDDTKAQSLTKKGIEVIQNVSVEDFASLNPSYALFSIGDHNDGGEYFEYCKNNNIDYVIINQLVKEDMWVTDKNQLNQIFDGYVNANATFFTCQNNINIFNAKMGKELKNADVHFNPISIDRGDYVSYPKVKKDYCLAFPGRLLTIHKGQDVLLEVLSSKKWEQRNIVVNFYGVGPDELKLKQLCKKYNLKNVNFCGYVDNVRKIWEDNHAFILTSHMEGIPIVLLGAMFAGRASIVTDVGGNKEILKDGKTGFIASSATVESVDEALERAWGLRNEWQELGKIARQDIKSLYPVDPIQDFKNKLGDSFKW